MKLLLVFLLLSTSAFAFDNKAIGGGLNLPSGQYNADLDADFDTKNPISFNLGMIGFHRSAKGKKYRTGLMLVSKKTEAEQNNVDFKLDLLYIMMPLTVVRSYGKNWDIFYGLNPALKIDDDCEYEAKANDKCEGDTSTFIHPLTIGLRRNFDKNINFEVSYEHALRENHTGVKINSLMFNVFYSL